jgi:hypothetical protein
VGNGLFIGRVMQFLVDMSLKMTPMSPHWPAIGACAEPVKSYSYSQYLHPEYLFVPLFPSWPFAMYRMFQNNVITLQKSLAEYHAMKTYWRVEV